MAETPKKQPKREKRTTDPTDSERVSQVTQDLRKSENYARTTQTRNSCVSKDSRSYHMSEEGLRSITVRKYKATTNSNHPYNVYANLLEQNFQATAPNEVWMADITYIPTDEGWLYLASIMDLYTRKIVG